MAPLFSGIYSLRMGMKNESEEALSVLEKGNGPVFLLVKGSGLPPWMPEDRSPLLQVYGAACFKR